MHIPQNAKELNKDVSLSEGCRLYVVKTTEKWWVNKTYYLVRDEIVSVLEQSGYEYNPQSAEYERFLWVKRSGCLGKVPRRNAEGVFEMVELD